MVNNEFENEKNIGESEHGQQSDETTAKTKTGELIKTNPSQIPN